jgi:RNA polymerase sigma factor (sigma-70 family)
VSVEETSLQAEAVGALFAQYEERIGRFLAQIVRSRSLADDLLQETFLAALRAGNELAYIENKQAWLFAIARNRALEALRKERRRERALERLRPVRVRQSASDFSLLLLWPSQSRRAIRANV